MTALRPSLLRHLLAWTLGALLVVWGSFVWFGWQTGVHESAELTDGHLASVASLMLARVAKWVFSTKPGDVLRLAAVRMVSSRWRSSFTKVVAGSVNSLMMSLSDNVSCGPRITASSCAGVVVRFRSNVATMA